MQHDLQYLVAILKNRNVYFQGYKIVHDVNIDINFVLDINDLLQQYCHK